jgi:hypothetical protein
MNRRPSTSISGNLHLENLAHEVEDPDHTLSGGPVLEILQNVVKALEEIDGKIVLKVRPKPKRRKGGTRRNAGAS